jgi:CheY-like chemotaxis protein
VDDDADDLEIFREALTVLNPGITVISADNGLAAFKLLQSLSGQLPDFIFLDINMPVMNGKEFLYVAMKEVSLHTIPIVIYSTTKNIKEINECFKLGARHFLIKPISFDQLVYDISKVIFPNSKVSEV